MLLAISSKLVTHYLGSEVACVPFGAITGIGYTSLLANMLLLLEHRYVSISSICSQTCSNYGAIKLARSNSATSFTILPSIPAIGTKSHQQFDKSSFNYPNDVPRKTRTFEILQFVNSLNLAVSFFLCFCFCER